MTENIDKLVIGSIETSARPVTRLDFSNLEKFAGSLADTFIDNGYVVAFLDHAVLTGKFQERKLVFSIALTNFDPYFIQKFRLFNKDKELYIWRCVTGYKARLRTDYPAKGGDSAKSNVLACVDTDQVLWGTRAEKIAGQVTKLTEKRGVELYLPIDIISVDEKENRVKIKTRNYIDNNILGQAGYIDCRFIDFAFGQNNLSIGGDGDE